MANYATNLFYLSTKNENDLDKVERFLNDNFQCCDLIREQGWIEASLIAVGFILKKKWTNC